MKTEIRLVKTIEALHSTRGQLYLNGKYLCTLPYEQALDCAKNLLTALSTMELTVVIE